MPGPISIEEAWTSSIGTVPALTHLSASITYFSAFGWPEHSTASTVSSGRSTHVSSEDVSSFDAAALQVSDTGSKIAVSVESIEPTRTRPSGRTQHAASPTSLQEGEGISAHQSNVG